MNAPFTADGTERGLDPRVVTLGRITGLVTAAVIALISFIAVASAAIGALASGPVLWLAVPALFGGWGLVNGALAWHMYRWPAIAYRHASYRVDAQGIEIRRGVYWRRIINVPRSRVQHTDGAEIGVFDDRHTDRTIVICALDNLGKGAAGQAVQNVNVLFGFAETTGLRLSGVLV